MKPFRLETKFPLVDSVWTISCNNHIKSEFLASYSNDHLQCQLFDFDIKSQISDVINSVVEIIKASSSSKISMRSLFSKSKSNIVIGALSSLQYFIQTDNLLIFIKYKDFNEGCPDEDDSSPVVRKINTFNFEIYADPTLSEMIVIAIRQLYENNSIVKVSWCYKEGNYISRKNMYIENDIRIHDEFYPFFKKGVDHFITKYLADPAAVLVMHGPPGTGKTSFLKYLLTTYKQNAMISYDEKIMQDDRFFIDFLTSNSHNLLIIEDADILLKNRENDDNVIMSKFLNVSDGLIKMPEKKLIFTTNISQLAKIDDALLRDGRCFANVEFRKLTSEEADRAAIKANLSNKDWKSKSSWSIAEIFKKDDEDSDNGLEKQLVVKTGFMS